MLISPRSILVRAHAVALFAVFSTRPAAGSDLKVFDDVITRNVMAAGLKTWIPFSFNVREHDNVRVYEGIYEFPRTGPAERYVFYAVVAPSGTLLDIREYERRRAELAEKPERSKDESPSEFEFPPIGKRAQRNVLSFGPGGAVFGLTFTTSDGKFDVRVAVSNLLPANVETPNFDIYETAQRISYFYDTKDIRDMGKHHGRAWYAVSYCGAKATNRLLQMQTPSAQRDPVAYQLGFVEGLADGEKEERERGREAACIVTQALYGPNGSNIPDLLE